MLVNESKDQIGKRALHVAIRPEADSGAAALPVFSFTWKHVITAFISN